MTGVRILEKLGYWAQTLKGQLLTLWFCRSHPGTPLGAKIMAALVVAYAFSPIDLIPDFIPVIGYLDDLILIPLGIYITLRMIPAPVLAEARVQAEAWIAEEKEKPKNYCVAVLFVAIWLAAAYWVCSVLSD